MENKKEKFSVLWAKQFTKRILILVFIGWVIGGLYGMVYEAIRLCIMPEMANIDGLLVYFAVPLTCGLPSYIIPNLFVKKKQVECCGVPDMSYIGGMNSGIETAANSNMCESGVTEYETIVR